MPALRPSCVRLGGSFAASLTTWIWIRRADQHHAYMSENMTTYDAATRNALDALGGAGQKAYAQLDQILTSQAYMMSTVDYFTLLGWMFMGLMLLVWLAKPPFSARGGARKQARPLDPHGLECNQMLARGLPR